MQLVMLTTFKKVSFRFLGKRDQTLKGIPLYHALKLLRILVDSSVQNAMKLYTSYSVLPSVMSYLAYDQW